MSAFNHVYVSIREFLYFASPLVFQRSGAEYEYRLYESLFPQQFGGADSLNGLAQSHLVGDNSLAGSCCEAYSLFLIGIKVGFEQSVKLLVAVSRHDILPCLSRPEVKYEVSRIFIASECVADSLCLVQEVAECVEGRLLQHRVLVEIILCQFLIFFLVIRSDAYLHAPFSPV